MELIIKIDNTSDFTILHLLLRRLGISFTEKSKNTEAHLPITLAEEPDFMAAFLIFPKLTGLNIRTTKWRFSTLGGNAFTTRSRTIRTVGKARMNKA